MVKDTAQLAHSQVKVKRTHLRIDSPPPDNQAASPAAQARIAAGFTSEQAAHKARISPSYLRSIEQKGSAAYVLALRLTHLYGCKIDVFFINHKTPHRAIGCPHVVTVWVGAAPDPARKQLALHAAPRAREANPMSANAIAAAPSQNGVRRGNKTHPTVTPKRHQIDRLLQGEASQEPRVPKATPEFPAVHAGENLAAQSRTFLLRCLDEQEAGDAQLFAALYDGRIVYDHAEKCWNVWVGHHYQRSKISLERRLVASQLAWQYLNLAATLTRESKSEGDSDEAGYKLKQADRLMERARQLRKLNRIKNVLELAGAYLGTDGELWDAQPHLLGVK